MIPTIQFTKYEETKLVLSLRIEPVSNLTDGHTTVHCTKENSTNIILVNILFDPG